MKSLKWGFIPTAEGGTLAWLEEYQALLVNAFVDIESTGFPFDPMVHQRFIERANVVYAEYEARLRKNSSLVRYCEKAGKAVEDFKFGSSQQLSAFLYGSKSEGALGLDTSKVSKSKITGKPSTDKYAIGYFAEQGNRFCQDLLVLKNFSTMLSSFGESLLKFYCEETGAVHPSYFLAKVVDGTGKYGGTASGRLSCARPNLQQLSKRDKGDSNVGMSGVEVRRSFVPRKGEVLVEIDQSQVEVRVAGMYAKDKQMGKFFDMGGDFHTRVASMVSGRDYDEMLAIMDDVDHPKHGEVKKLRSSAKQITFGLLYGMGIPKLIKECGMKKEEGEEFIQTYFGIFPELAAWRNKTIDDALRTGEAHTLFGRVRQLRIGNKISRDKREERIGVNTPIQSAASDIVLYALAVIWWELRSKGYVTRIIGTIHDSIIFSVPVEELNVVLPWVVKFMTNPPGLEWLLEDSPIRLAVSVDMGLNFKDMYEVPIAVIESGKIEEEHYAFRD